MRRSARRWKRASASASTTGVAILESDDLLAIGELAEPARRLRGGTDEVYFVQNLYVNQTNVCRVKCKFCAFAATQKQPHAYTFTKEELVEDVLRQRQRTGFPEIHMVNGESPHVDFAFYRDTTAALHEALPDVHLKLYTASEIHHMTTLSGLTHEEVLRELKSAGLGFSSRAAGRRSSRIACAGWWRPERSPRRSGSTSTTRRTHSAFRRTARCSTATSRPKRTASITW